MLRTSLLVFLIVVHMPTASAQVFAAPARKAATPPPVVDDVAALKQVDLTPTDASGLTNYFRQRTLSEADLTAIRGVINRLGDESFKVRMSASADLVKFGPAAIGLLRSVSQTHLDPEIAYRASEALKQIEKVPHQLVAAAAARAVAKLKPRDGAEALLGFLPMADSPAVEDAVSTALVALALTDAGKLSPEMLAGLKQKNPIRRAAAAVALLKAAGPAERSEAIRSIAPLLEGEMDGETKFQMAYAIVTLGKSAVGFPALLQCLPDVSRGRLWQIEDYIQQLAGADCPKVKLGPGRAELIIARDAWSQWWKANADKHDISKFDYRPTTSGGLVLHQMDQVNSWGTATLAEYGPDQRRRWRIGGLQAPLDFQLLPDEKVLIVEQQYQRITERDLAGNTLYVHGPQQYGMPLSAHRTSDGHTIVAYQRTIVEYDKQWKETPRKYVSQNADFQAARQLGTDPLVVLTRNPMRIVRLDEKWKELPNPLTFPSAGYFQNRLQALPEGRVLIVEQSRIAEYDIKLGRKDPVWSFTCSQPISAHRMTNGNILLVESASPVIKEITPAKEVIWSYTPPEGMRAVRAERR